MTSNGVASRLAGLALALLLAQAGTVGAGDARVDRRMALSEPFGLTALRMGARRLGRVEGARRVTGSIAFRLRNEGELERLVAAQQDRSSALFQAWVTPIEFGQRFGADEAVRASLRAWLRDSGIRVTREWRGGTGIEFEGPARAVERAFIVTLADYDLDGARVVANDEEPRIPVAFAATVLGVRLDTVRRVEPVSVRREHRGTDIAVKPRDFYVAYDVGPLFDDGIDGTGQAIAVLGRSDFDFSDVAMYRSSFGLPPARVEKVPAGDGIVNVGGGDEVEALVDVQLAGMAAPGATVQCVISDPDSDLDQSLAYAVNELPDTRIISVSYGACEMALGPTFQALFNNLYRQAAAQGQTVLVASGDYGSNDCFFGTVQSVNGLASSPHVTAVGGTALLLRFDDDGNATEYVRELTWEHSGGGVSGVYARPPYQLGGGPPAGAMRAMPDVAVLGDPLVPGYFYVRHGAIGTIGGTSASAPAWAGIIALASQFEDAKFGTANYRIYQLGVEGWLGGPVVFKDPVGGTNASLGVPGFTAVEGYDLCTGWGSPIADAFVRNFAGAESAASRALLVRPNGGEFITAGAPILMDWTIGAALAPMIVSQDICMSTDGGSSFQTVGSGLALDARHFELNPAGLVSARVRMRLVLHTASGMVLEETSDADSNVGTTLRIETGEYRVSSKQLRLTGSGLTTVARLFVNSERVDKRGKFVSDDTLAFKGKAKKLKLRVGANSVQLEIDGVLSSPITVYRSS